MKKIITTCLLLCSICHLQAQTSIINISKQETTINFSSILPLKVVFDNSLNNQNIELYDIKGKTFLALKNGIIGKTPVDKKNDDGEFLFKINGDGLIEGNKASNDSKIKDGFTIKVNDKIVAIVTLGKIEDSTPTPLNKSADYKPGYLFYDALELKNILQRAGGSGNTMEIFKSYGIDTNTLKLNPYGKVFVKFYAKGYAQGGDDNRKPLQAHSAIGNLNVGTFADGLAKFLVERAKEELNVAFFEKLKDQFEVYPEFRIFFPNTLNVLSSINSYQYTSMLQTLKESFETDIQMLPSTLPQIRNFDRTYCIGSSSSQQTNCIRRMDAISTFFNGNEGAYAKLGLALMEEIVAGQNPADLIHNISTSPEMENLLTKDNIAKNCGNTILLADVISQSLLYKGEDDKLWASEKELRSLFSDIDGVYLYLGLLYQQQTQREEEVQFIVSGSEIKFSKILVNIHETINTANNEEQNLLKALKDFATVTDNINATVLKIKNANANGSQIDFASYHNLYKSFSSTLKLVSTLPVIKTYPQAVQVKQLLDSIIDPSADLIYNVSVKKYSAAILNLTTLLEKSKLFKKNDEILKPLLKYGTFISTVATAQNSDDVKNAIEAAVLPVGSASIKRETDFNISLNAFIGPFGGGEYLPAKTDNQLAFSTGLTAPVGLAFSWGNLKCDKTSSNVGGKSFSIFIPVIDVGAMAAFRINDSQSNIASEVKLKNIIAPGLYFYHGFAKCPVSIGYGAQVGPQLRSINSTSANINENIYVRFGVNLVVDIPMLNLYTETK
jgi:hypothetical protein